MMWQGYDDKFDDIENRGLSMNQAETILAQEIEIKRLREVLTNALLTDDEYAQFNMVAEWDAAQEALSQPTPTTGLLNVVRAAVALKPFLSALRRHENAKRPESAVFAFNGEPLRFDHCEKLLSDLEALPPEVMKIVERS